MGACDIATWPTKARDEPQFYRIAGGREHDGNNCGGGFCGKR
jgi:hypothetical protein